MDHKQLKRTRSTDSMDRSFKRSKGYEELQLTDIYPTQQQQPQQQQAVLKPISISTKTDTVSTISYATHAPVMSYEQINGLLHSVHIERFGNPETRCQEQDVDMTEVDNEYSDMNSVLRQAFLQRH